MVETGWLVGMVVGLPLAAYVLALGWPGQFWSTRSVPADGFRLATGVAFAAWVHPALGLLAAHSAVWWAWRGWKRLPGGTLWPTVAMAVWLLFAVPSWAMSLAVNLLLGLGVFEVGFGIAQWRGCRYVFSTGSQNMIHGTFGHRTGYGIYLAMLTPLAFTLSNPWMTWILVGIYTTGLILSRSMVAGAAMGAGVLWIHGGLWPIAVGVFGLGTVMRLGPLMWARRAQDARRIFWSAPVKPWLGRLRIWRIAGIKIRQAWLWGYGAGTFGRDSRTWYRKGQLKEFYGECHNEYLEAAYEYGMVGALAVGWVLWDTWPALAVGDPYTGSLAAAGVSAGFNFPLRVATLAVTILIVAMIVMRRAHGWAL